jgi:predicted HAD superfamily Cof-like phosphohydrolase
MSGRSEHQRRVDEFMLRAKQDVPGKPTLPSEKVRRLRASLILEEAFETVHALGFEVLVYAGLVSDKEDFEELIDLYPNEHGSLKDIADGCADVIVVTTGTLSACGISDESLQREVDENNLAKFGPGHSWNENGKLIKPPDHKPPDIEGVLKRQGEEPAEGGPEAESNREKLTYE